MLKSAIIGLGNIGIGFDIPSWKDTGVIMSHAKAYLRHKGFDLQCGIDSSAQQRSAFTKYTGKPAYSDIKSLKGKDIDVVSVCVPTQYHASVISELVRNIKPKCIICEKPIASNTADYESIMEDCRCNNITLAVNYIRRWDKASIRLKELFKREHFGKIRSVHCYYANGLFNNASHGVDLLHYWFGIEKSVRVISCADSTKKGDKDVNFIASYSDFDAIFQSVNANDYSIFEIEVHTQKARIVYKDSGESVGYFKRMGNAKYNSYHYLSSGIVEIPNDLKRYQFNVIKDVYNRFIGQKKMLSGGKSAGETLKTCLEVKKLCKN